MRLIILPVAALAIIGATDVDEKSPHIPQTTGTVVLPFDNPSYVRTPAQARLIERAQVEAPPTEEQCRDRITKARAEAGKEDLPAAEPASPDKPYHIYAVDKRIAGCAVMVMKGDAKDVRPLPPPAEGPPVVTPAADADE